ncbi:MAG: RNA-binding protein [Ignisphaera sp.]
MRPLGSVLHITRSRYIIVKIHDKKSLPILGSDVVDPNNEIIGKVIDVIGPIDKPFAVVKAVKPGIVSFLKPSTFLFYRTKKIGRGKKH